MILKPERCITHHPSHFHGLKHDPSSNEIKQQGQADPGRRQFKGRWGSVCELATRSPAHAQTDKQSGAQNHQLPTRPVMRIAGCDQTHRRTPSGRQVGKGSLGGWNDGGIRGHQVETKMGQPHGETHGNQGWHEIADDSIRLQGSLGEGSRETRAERDQQNRKNDQTQQEKQGLNQVRTDSQPIGESCFSSGHRLDHAGCIDEGPEDDNSAEKDPIKGGSTLEDPVLTDGASGQNEGQGCIVVWTGPDAVKTEGAVVVACLGWQKESGGASR